MTASDAMGWTVVLILTLMVCVGCAAQDRLVYVPVKLQLPPPPTLPTVPRAELACLAEDTADQLFYRQQALECHRLELRAVICTTRDDCPEEPGPEWGHACREEDK